MAGIYIHIPFCKSRCRYCDFYSTTLGEMVRERYVDALVKEIHTQSPGSLPMGATVNTVYLGGGTPSLLTTEQLARLLTAIRTAPGLQMADNMEITMEANPGDLTQEKLQQLRETGINRLSIGIQSFTDTLLQRIGRRHTAAEALRAIHDARSAGFDNLSIDLMYGLPGQTMADWQHDVQEVVKLRVQHVSAYCLSYEEGTPLYQQLEKGELTETDDEVLNAMQDYLEAALEDAGIIRYEISNYALPGAESRHNSSYWDGTPYWGIGAGAHSYDGNRIRSWAVADDLHDPTHWHYEEEHLSDDDLYNELVMLGLRTRRGVDMGKISSRYLAHFLGIYDKLEREGLLVNKNGCVRATKAGSRLLNRIIENLMI